jgi:hypothetical protein
VIPQLWTGLRRLAGIGAAWLLSALLLLPGALVLSPAHPGWAGPVSWQELPASAEGRQWWDSGSLRLSRQGHLSVLSRFQPAPPPASDAAAAAASPSAGATAQPTIGTGPGTQSTRQAPGSLYVMELDCDQALYRDLAVNGLPRWGSPWQPAGPDDLVRRLLNEVCAAGANLRQVQEGSHG